MNPITTPKLTLDQVKAQFQAWRNSRVGRERIPEHLWAAAIELVQHYPISTVYKKLLLDPKQLKQRLANSHEPTLSMPPTQFLEIKPTEIAAQQQQHSFNNRQPIDAIRPDRPEPVCRIAFERVDGSRLTISLPADSHIIPAICANLMKG